MVMPALVAGIHVFPAALKAWMAGTSLDKPGHDARILPSRCKRTQPHLILMPVALITSPQRAVSLST